MATFRFYNTVAVNISIGIAWLWRFVHSPVIFLGERKDWEDMEGKPMGLYHKSKDHLVDTMGIFFISQNKVLVFS